MLLFFLNYRQNVILYVNHRQRAYLPILFLQSTGISGAVFVRPPPEKPVQVNNQFFCYNSLHGYMVILNEIRHKGSPISSLPYPSRNK
jgi:hypothetical protein